MKTKLLPPQKGQILSGDIVRRLWNRDKDKPRPNSSKLRQKLDRLKIKLVDYILGGLGIILWTFLLATIVWWLLAVVIWPGMDTPYNREVVPLSIYSNNYFEVWSPRVIHGGGAPVEIRFSLRQENITGQPITIEMTIPNEFIVQDPTTYLTQSVSIDSGDPLSKPITVEMSIPAESNVKTTTTHLTQTVSLIFDSQLIQESASIQLINANLSRKLGISQQELKIKVIGFDKQIIKSFTIPLGAEGTWRYVIRTLGGVSPDNLPLFPFAALLVSIGGLWLKQNEENRRQGEKRIEEAKRRAENLFETIRGALRSGNIMAAEQSLDRMRQESLINHIEEKKWRNVEQIIEFSQGKSVRTEALDLELWLEETAGTLLYMAEKGPFSRQEISAMLRVVMPLDRLKDGGTRRRLEVVKEVLGLALPPVRVTWPSRPLIQQELSNLPQKKGFKNPFREDHAENEVSLLFRNDNQLFWSEHPLLKELMKVNDTTIVIGNHGSGCTAFAMAVGRYYYWTEEPVPFTCFIQGTPSMAEVRLALANRLLQFLEQDPHYLILMGNEQKTLAAQILVSEIGKNLLLSRLEAASPTHQERWLENAEKDENKRKVWKAEAQTHVNLMVEAIRQSDINPTTDNVWSMALAHCLRLLKFKDTILISIDAGDTFSGEWYQNVIAPHHQIWNEQGLHSIIFTTPAAYNTTKIKPTLLPQIKTLQWQAEELGKMLQARWVAANGRRPIGQLFNKDTIAELLGQAKGNPRQLIHLWREILVKRRSPIPVEIEAVTKAVKDLSDDL
jgi:hypothetical protein